MDKNQLKRAVQTLVTLDPGTLKSQYGRFLSLLKTTHHQFIQAIVDNLEKPTEDLGLSQEELVGLAKRLNSTPVNRVVYGKLSPSMKEKNAALAEDSFTSTANTAPYPVPIGTKMLRRKFPKNPKN